MMEEFCMTILAFLVMMAIVFFPLFVYASYCSIKTMEENSRKNKDKEKDTDKVKVASKSENNSNQNE